MTLDSEGKYTWHYDMDMKQNRSVINLVLKIVIGLLIFLFAFIAFLYLKEGDVEGLMSMSGVLAGCAVAIIAICYFAYWYTCKVFDHVYSWDYEMDEEGIRYWQPKDQAEKAKNIAKGAAAVGAMTGNLGLAAAGTANALTDVNEIKFKNVTILSKNEKEDLISLHAIFMHHMIYVDKKDYDFVYSFIADRVRH